MILSILGNMVTSDVKGIINANIRTKIYNNIFEMFNNDMVANDDIMDIISIQKNKEDEVIAVDYRFNNAYKYLKDSMEALYKKIEDTDFSDSYYRGEHGVFFVPSTVVSHNVLINELGFRIPVKVHVLKNVDINFKTKVKNYGINNILVELYLNIRIVNELLVVGDRSLNEENYEIVIAAKLITGKIPMYYGNMLEKSSSIVSS